MIASINFAGAFLLSVRVNYCVSFGNQDAFHIYFEVTGCRKVRLIAASQTPAKKKNISSLNSFHFVMRPVLNSIMTICKNPSPESNFSSIHLNYNAIIIIPMLELYTPSAGISSFYRWADFMLHITLVKAVCVHACVVSVCLWGKTHKTRAFTLVLSHIRRLIFQTRVIMLKVTGLCQNMFF